MLNLVDFFSSNGRYLDMAIVYRTPELDKVDGSIWIKSSCDIDHDIETLGIGCQGETAAFLGYPLNGDVTDPILSE